MGVLRLLEDLISFRTLAIALLPCELFCLPTGPGEPVPASPTVTVKASRPLLVSAEGLWFQVTLENSQPGCRAAIVTNTFFAFPDERPQTLLDFEIRDESGQTVPRSHRGGFLRVRYSVGSLITLHCGASFGYHVVVGKPEWEYDLAPGRYRLRVRIENRVRSYFEHEPEALQRLIEAKGLNSELTMEQLQDFSVVSDEIEIDVGK